MDRSEPPISRGFDEDRGGGGTLDSDMRIGDTSARVLIRGALSQAREETKL